MNLLETLTAMEGFSAEKKDKFSTWTFGNWNATHAHTRRFHILTKCSTPQMTSEHLDFSIPTKKQNKLINHIDTAAKRRMLDMYTFERWKRKEKQIISIQWIVQRSERQKIEYRRIFNMLRNAPYAMHKNWFLFGCCCWSSRFLLSTTWCITFHITPC